MTKFYKQQVSSGLAVHQKNTKNKQIDMSPRQLNQTSNSRETSTRVEGAVCVLNSLQNNAAAPERLRGRREDPDTQLAAMQGFLRRTGMTVGEVDRLNVVYVTGTKGKGSSCAFTERVLRSHGFRTGFYSSPHLVHVRERIRINGRPISKQLFTKYFWEAYERLEDTKDVHGGAMPFYFQFLTLLAFHVFLQEQVDLAVVEVGIGGQHDCTNIIRKPWVCGITSLGFDHCSLLGDTLEQIAWQKAGIFKPGVPAFTVRQPAGALKVLQRRAEDIGCPLWVCPQLDQYEAVVGPVRLGLAGRHQRSNASLALQMSSSWLQRHQEDRTGGPSPAQTSSQAAAFRPSAAMLEGLQQTEWLGRNQVLRRGSVTFYLDGAHTTASMEACVSWFRQELLQSRLTRGPGVRMLLFNTTGGRDSAALLGLLAPCEFDHALFCPNETAPSGTAQHGLRGSCAENQNLWQSLNATNARNQRPLLATAVSHSRVHPGVLSALQWIGLKEREGGRVSVLVTGSLYLVGGVLRHLGPSVDP